MGEIGSRTAGRMKLRLKLVEAPREGIQVNSPDTARRVIEVIPRMRIVGRTWIWVDVGAVREG